MELSKKERLFLYNQYEILKSLYPDEFETYEYNQKILVDGYKYNYSDLLSGFGEEVDPAISAFVFDVLQMYRSFHNSYYSLTDNEKDEINQMDITFQGFDGNEEIDHYIYARFVLEEMNRFDEIYNNGRVELNSHRNMIARYSRMVDKWKSISNRYDLLTLEQIQEILE